MTFTQLLEKMKEAEQSAGQSVLQHGESVHAYYVDLINHLRNNAELKLEWKLPQWLLEFKQQILDGQLNFDDVRMYQIMHDCGKPFCMTYDEQGKKHFANHAQVSYNTWLTVSDNLDIANLILHDMDIHTIKADDVVDFCKLPYAMTLLLTGLCEVHSNAEMFGGVESTSFKIKWKQIDRRGNAICKTQKA